MGTSCKRNAGSFETGPVSPATSTSFLVALVELLRSPQRMIWLWNWKSALLSLVMRGPIFLIATVRRGWELAFLAVLTESIYCVLTAGFYGAVVQILRDADPEWLTAVFLTVVIPAVFQVLEYLLHWIRGTPHLRIAELVSIGASAVSALFNWYAMRRGALLVGGEGRGFISDLCRLPRLILGFLAVVPRHFLKRRVNNGSGVVRRLGTGECP